MLFEMVFYHSFQVLYQLGERIHVMLLDKIDQDSQIFLDVGPIVVLVSNIEDLAFVEPIQ